MVAMFEMCIDISLYLYLELILIMSISCHVKMNVCCAEMIYIYIHDYTYYTTYWCKIFVHHQGFPCILSSMRLDVHFPVRVALRKTITRLVAF